APGTRHPKRYLDVEEIIAAGIDVFATLNIQHVESLNDVIARITRIRVRETVPDGILDQADDIEVIDLSPEDLIKRLREGKVYVPQQAARAIRHYFSQGNLTALRELALRRTAQRVDEQLLSHMRAHAIAGPWAAGERVLVCVSEAPSTAGLIRYARRVADRMQVPWTAISVEPAPPKSVQTHPGMIEPFRVEAYLGSAGAVSVALGIGQVLSRVIDVHSASLTFLMAVLGSAVAWGLLPSLFASVLSVLAYNFS